jgi:hypothetical protein
MVSVLRYLAGLVGYEFMIEQGGVPLEELFEKIVEERMISTYELFADEEVAFTVLSRDSQEQ